jgi:hypothetical protein
MQDPATSSKKKILGNQDLRTSYEKIAAGVPDKE